MYRLLTACPTTAPPSTSAAARAGSDTEPRIHSAC